MVEFEVTSGKPAPNVSGRNAMVRRPLVIANPPRMNIGTWWQVDDELSLSMFPTWSEVASAKSSSSGEKRAPSLRPRINFEAFLRWRIHSCSNGEDITWP